jgi:hypothetical protein
MFLFDVLLFRRDILKLHYEKSSFRGHFRAGDETLV